MVAESEIWPNLLCLVKERQLPVVLVNARLSARSYRRWQKMPRLIAALLSRIDLCLAQSQDDGTRLQSLGAPRVEVSGNLKYDVAAPPFQAATLAEITGALAGRPVWLAASTHAGEEEIVLAVHRQLRQIFPSLLTIVAPRHPARGAEIAGLAAAHGVPASQRSRGDRIETATEFYIADTMGELGLFYRLASVVLVGKSLGAAEGGQNPIEPAKLGTTVLHGPHVANFIEVYRDLDAAHGATEVVDAAALAQTLRDYLSDPAQLRRSGRAAQEAVERFSGASDRIIQALEPLFRQIQVENR
jgi:3-deoxy-D-manno-octulosonic-acid transferase